MVSVILASIFVFCVFYLFYRYSVNKPDNFPPGPPKIPIFGSYLFLLLINFKWLHLASIFLSKFYKSKIIGLYIGPFATVVVNYYEGVKEVLNRREFDGRPDLFLGRLRDPHFNRRGIFFIEGPVWKEQRRFVLRFLRDFGFGRRYQELEVVINEELLDLVDQITNGPKYPHEKEIFKKGQALCPYFLSGCAMNCFFYMLCGERLPRSEQEPYIELVKQGMVFQRTGDDYGLLLSIMPWIRYIFPNISGYKPLRESNAVMYEFVQNIVDKNLKTYNENYERHFLDLYIKEMKQAEKNGEETNFTYDQLLLGLVDFAFPALTAIESQISLLLQWFLIKPELLKNVQKEIDEVVGRSRLPTLDDRKDMPLTEATLRECLRIETLVPSSIPHSALVDTELQGYKIPKNCVVIPGLYAFHMDKNIWGDSENFRPERFLDENGKLSLKKDISLPFGAGKRLCAGETFARNMMFLMTGALCQNFNVVLQPGEQLPDMSKNHSGIIVTPYDFWVNLVPR